MSDKLLTVSGAQTLYNDTRTRIEAVDTKVDSKVGYATVEDGYLILKASEDSLEEIAKLTGFGGGGGGGGGSSNPAILTVKNITSWGNRTTISNSTKLCEVRLNWSSLEDGQSTNNGILVIKTRTRTLKTLSIEQGIVTVNVREFLDSGDNTLFFTVSDVYGNSRTLSFTISVTLYYLESYFNENTPYYDTEEIPFTYNPVGSGLKQMVFKLDGTVIGEEETSASNSTQFFYITPEMWVTHGIHALEVYFIDQDGNESNKLNFNLICVKTGDTTPIISTHFNQTVAKKYETLDIVFTIFNPAAIISNAVLTLNGVSETRENIKNNELQHWSYRIMETNPLAMSITTGETTVNFNITVNGSIIPIEPSTSGLGLYLTSSGRDNAAIDKDIWAYNSIQAEFSNFNWVTGIDGWNIDQNGYVALTVKGDGRVYIPYQIFNQNFAVQNGKTIEFEFSTSDVNDYTATVISCFNGNRGINITAQDVTLRSEQSYLYTQFKEDEHVRISFVVDSYGMDPQTGTPVGDRLMFCYINGILSGVVEYKDGDNFSQAEPVGITIGSSDVTTNIYNIRVYNRALSRKEILDNWICDKQSSADLLAAYEHNNIYDDDTHSKIVIEKLPSDLPYLVMYPQRKNGTHVLPQDKTDKIPCDGYYVDPLHPEKNFTFVDAEAAVQGTSSAGYPRKNYKIKFKKGKDALDRPNFSWKDNEGKDIKGWAMNETAIPVNTFCFKADFASSEGANNVELVKLYNNLIKSFHKIPAQLNDEDENKDKYRVGIDGFPILIFYNDGNSISFLGKYNFNNDKSTENVFGFEDGDECWEITNNDSELANWRSDVLATEENPLLWTEAFEARFPDVGKAADITKLQELSSWLATTNRNNIFEKRLKPGTEEYETIDTGIPIWADLSKTETDPETGEPIYHGADLPEPVTLPEIRTLENGAVYYVDTEYTEDNGNYRLSKFRKELADHFNVNSTLFYYLFTEFFLMVDSRAKNAFPTIYDEEGKWCWLPYDMDTALGINNEGKLVFGYSLEDTDILEGGKKVYNGQYSVIWNNLRDAFPTELTSMYQQMVSAGLNYTSVETAFENHQSKWPEAIFNEDAYFKYLQPYLEDGDDFLEMCLGSKTEQRKWWLYNRFRYVDSKYRTGESLNAQILFRAYSSGNLVVTPYADIYARVRLGATPDSPTVGKRAYKNEETRLDIVLGDQTNDLDCYIQSADQLKDIGDLSVFNPGLCNLAPAIKLQRLKVGKDTVNPNLTSLTLGNNVLLKYIDVRNCPNLPGLDVSGCTNLQTLLLEGCTSLPSVNLPKGGMMETLHLPANMTSLKIENQRKITDFQLEGYSKLTTLVLNDVSQEVQRDTITILHNMPDLSRVQLYNFDTVFNSVAEFEGYIADLDRMVSYDGTGPQANIAQIIGSAKITNGTLTSEYVSEVQARYPNLDILCNIKKTVKFYNYDGSVRLDTQPVTTYAHVSGSVPYRGSFPTRADSATTHYVFDGWTKAIGTPITPDIINNIDKSYNLYAHFEEIPIYTVKFYNYDGKTLIQTKTTRPDLGSYVEYTGSVPSCSVTGYTQTAFLGWGTQIYGGVDVTFTGNRLENVTESLNLYAQLDWAIRDNSIEIDETLKEYQKYYFAYEAFNPTDLVITVEKQVPTGAIRTSVQEYTYSQDPLEPGTTAVTVTVNENNSIEVPIYLAQSLTVSKEPDKYFQYTNQPLDLAGMELTITYADGYEVVDSAYAHYAVEPMTLAEEGLQAVEITYYKGGLVCTHELLALTRIMETLEENSWPAIAAVVGSNRIPNTWHIGDTKSVYISSSLYSDDGQMTSVNSGFTAGNYSFRILAIDHNLAQETPHDADDQPLYDHSITFGMAKMIDPRFPSLPPVEIVDGSAQAHLRGEDSNSTYTCWNKSWNTGCGLTEVCDKFMHAIPPVLKKIIKPVIKGQADTDFSEQPTIPRGMFAYGAIKTQQNYAYIPSLYEITGMNFLPPKVGGSYDQRESLNILESTVCKQFEYYKTIATEPRDRIRYVVNNSEYQSPGQYWTRTWLCARGMYPSTGIDYLNYYYFAKIDQSGSGRVDLAINSDPNMICFTL